MIEDRTSDIEVLRERVARIAEYLHLEEKRADLAVLEERTTAPDFWNDQNQAQQVMAQASGLRDEIESYESMVADLDELEVANELALAEADEGMAAEATVALKDIARRSNDLELASWVPGEFDSGDALVTILPGQGGLEAQDWAEMLLKMLSKYAAS
ncbi:MAG: PCRF domain-containing protein, partial [Actinomycetota bacterium]|nr:PCRF domain-containing protein [Actinomycetota bacterium]